MITYIFYQNTGIDAGDSIQLAVKIAYPKEEIAKKKVRTCAAYCYLCFYLLLYLCFLSS